MKLAAFFLLAFVATVYATGVRTVNDEEFVFGVTELAHLGTEEKMTGEEAYQFILGIVEGIGGDLGHDAEQCLSDSYEALNYFIDGYNELVQNDAPLKFARDCGRGLEEIYSAVKACGSAEGDIKNAAELLLSGGLSVVWHAGISLVIHGVEIYHWVKDCYESFEGGSYNQAGRDIGDIISTLL
ncbi:hypothetical protein J8273_3554 [Carpediemonas membranifera]|uniref:Secreted protein n=1 Tax=Carpediemonas membranifera TaxID=201153 RepID=A0A8J6BAN4_9EUKA|nr:hypothetical protein J8273_3553 [Carpediemonas membranifera]KAG9393418.1 hypothetical protein J8273_3554 [Carpediemonas membranifera]|eukprot:KAG9393417.1 hypothetical protein J8273_3553 [Carpediemonas membranifera]